MDNGMRRKMVYKQKRRRKRRRGPSLQWKFFLLLLVLAVLLVLSISAVRGVKRTQPEGRYITAQEALNLVWALQASLRETQRMEPVRALEEQMSDPEAPLTYEQFQVIESSLELAGTPQFSKTYKKEFSFLAADFFTYYEKALEVYDIGQSIRKRQLVLLGTQKSVTDPQGAPLPTGSLLAQENGSVSVFASQAEVLARVLYRPAVIWEKDGTLLALERVDGGTWQEEEGRQQLTADGGTETAVTNAWIVEVPETGVRFFYQGYTVMAPGTGVDAAAAEQVADVVFAGGQVSRVTPKLEKVTGRLLRVTEEKIELEGAPSLPVQKGTFPVYQVYGGLKSLDVGELRLGYDFTDFVLENGRVIAAVVVKDGAMENVRVLIKTSDYGAAFHDSVEFRCDVDAVLSFGEQTETVPAGEVRMLDGGSPYFAEADRVVLTPQALSARTELLNIERSQGTPSCRGSLEITKTGDGLLVVNELLLEEYLYAVVPSEMPASYPEEALKAQAICARTYAYKRMQRAGLAKYGAHVDDSAGFQVYNNIAENAATTQAVRKTKGQVLTFDGGLADTYYYSTSCGFGTDLSVWKSADPAMAPYLAAQRICRGAGSETPEGMQEDGKFDAYIRQVWPEDYESGEGWYRWEYTVQELEPATVLKNLQGRYAASQSSVLTKQKDGSFAAEPVEILGKINNIAVAHRSPGGAADELLIEGEKRTYRVMTELAVRYALFDPQISIRKQDGKEVSGFSMLPSAYFAITPFQKKGSVIGYELAGGGFGHGVGMSQNGAGNMAAAGLTGSDILTFFYRGCGLETVY